MIKPDEKEFMQKIILWGGRIPAESWDYLTKRQHYLLSKWSDKGWWNYGVSLRSGWLEIDGFVEMTRVTTEKPKEKYEHDCTC